MSDYNQTSFLGGMNLLADDTRLQPNQYRIGINIRNRYDVLDEIKAGRLDEALPAGIIQEMVTFGEYVIAFVSGAAYYRRYNSTGWGQILDFEMSNTAPRFWTCAVPVATTNYIRLGHTSTIANNTDARGLIEQVALEGAAQGNVPGLLVQDNENQPRFIFLSSNGVVNVRITQTFDQWDVDYTTTVTNDKREYVPIGNAMAFVDGVLYIVGQDRAQIYHSVSGRPLDFMVNITPAGKAGGDASTTAYSVGNGDITCLRGMPDGSLFVAAGNANYALVKNTANNAPLLFGEFMYVRKFLFEATCLNDRCIIDSLGDTRFIDLNGIRSFNAVQQLMNEGRNSPFSATIQSVLSGITQDVAAAILYDNYELYALNTTFGPAIAVFDTISGCWTSFDLSQTGGSKVKQFAKIELGVQALYAITEDNRLYQLYASDEYATASVLTGSMGFSQLNGIETVKMNNARNETKLEEFRCVVNKITRDCTLSVTPIIDNRISTNVGTITKSISYVDPSTEYIGTIPVPNANSQLTNLFIPMPNCEHGWKTALLISWTGGGSIVQYSTMLKDISPKNPLLTQATTR